MLDERKAEVLRGLVEEHIRSGDPVSSRAILDATGLGVSAATVRNDLVALERDGYAVQPHTSAGRVPTAKAYRYYVDHLSRRPLRSTTKVKIHEFFGTVQQELGRLLRATTDLLSDITHYPAVVVGPGLPGESVCGVHLVQLGAQVVLVVMITSTGRVTKELAKLEAPATGEEIEVAEQALSRLLDGRHLAQIGPDVDLSQRGVSTEVREVVAAALGAAVRSQHATRELYVGGASQLASLWEDLATVHRVLGVLEREAMLLSILAHAPEGTAIQIGNELPVDEEVDLALVSAAYAMGGVPAGRVGVIGPMRMDYRRAISVVEEVSHGLADSLGP